MPPLTRELRELCDSLAEEFLATYGSGRTVIALDGDTGTRHFSRALAQRLGKGSHAVFRASVDRFYRPKAQRLARGADAADAHYNDAFDYDLLRRVLIEPFRLGGSTGFVTSAFDVERDVPKIMKWKTGPQDATLILDGAYLIRPELRGLWNYSIWLDGGTDAADGQKLYLAEANPRARANAIVNNTDPDHPRREFADGC